MSEHEVERLRAAAVERYGMDIVLGAARTEHADTLAVAPVESVRCVGVMLDRATGAVHVLGSAVSLETYVWAYARGFVLDAPNMLVVTAVRDRDATLDVFKRGFIPRYVRFEVEPQLARLPFRTELDWPTCALMLEALRDTAAFDYEVNPRE